MDNKQPLVSVCCITYNHKDYILKAIEGFLMQKTTFPIEIIIHDDASTDDTAEIVKEYAEKYPELIVPILQTENQYSKGIRPSPTYVWPRARGKYIALCEGDDYWIDPLKLQKQVDFLEANEEYVMVYTDFNTVDKNGVATKLDIRRRPLTPSGNILPFLAKRNFIKSLTVLVRTAVLKNANNKLAEINEFEKIDYSLFFEIGGFGKVYYLNEKTASYRLLQESASHSTNYKNRLKFLENTHAIKSFYNKKFQLGITNRQLSRELLNNKLSILSQSKEVMLFFKCFYRGIKEDWVHLILPVNYFHFLVLILSKLKS